MSYIFEAAIQVKMSKCSYIFNVNAYSNQNYDHLNYFPPINYPGNIIQVHTFKNFKTLLESLAWIYGNPPCLNYENYMLENWVDDSVCNF